MKTTVPNYYFKPAFLVLFIVGTLHSSAQTYTTVSNGSWTSASTWKNGSVPAAGNIRGGVIINIKHIVTYSGGGFSNDGTINIANPGGVSPRLIIASGVDITNKSSGRIYVTNGEMRQYRFLGGLELGIAQPGKYKNEGLFKAENSFVEFAQDWSNEASGTVILRNAILAIGRDLDLKANAIDTIENSSVSVGLHGSGSYTADGGKVYFKNARFEVSNLVGSFTLKKGLANGSIEFIGLKNRLTGLPGTGKITASNNLTTTGGLSLKSYCLLAAANFEPNGKFAGTKKADCALSLFPAGLMSSTAASSFNFSSTPTLQSGTALQVGATYKYEGVTPGVDAIVKIDSLINGATITKIDDNTGGLGYIEGFQPEVRTGTRTGESYAVFTMNYVKTGTSLAHSMNTFSITALDIDGSNTLKEFNQIQMGVGAVATYVTSNATIAIKTIAPGVFRGTNVNGVEHDGIDTAGKNNMFTVTNSNVTSFTLKLGATKTNTTQTVRQFGIYMKGFVYPNLSTLPVKLEYFTAVPDMNMSNVLINWASSAEKNVSHFVIEKSTDGKNYAQAGVVFATGNSSNFIKYTFTDNNIDATARLIYYRLRSVDNDATSELSQVRTIRLGGEATKGINITSYPNPFTSEFRVTVPAGWYGKAISFEILNSNGQAVVKRTLNAASQTETFAAGRLAPGLYILKATCNGEVAQQKMIKQ
jgi:hypothetical protein